MVRSAGGLHTPVGRSLHRAFQTMSDRLADMCKMRILVRVTSLASIGWLTPNESTGNAGTKESRVRTITQRNATLRRK